MPELPCSTISTMNANVLPEEPQTHPVTLALLLLALVASVIGTVLLILAVFRYHTSDGTALTSDWLILLGRLEKMRDLSAAVSILFALTIIHFRIARGGAAWSILGTLVACAQALYFVGFASGYVDCFADCGVPAPSDLLWPAFWLCMACIVLGSLSAIAVWVVGPAEGPND